MRGSYEEFDCMLNDDDRQVNRIGNIIKEITGNLKNFPIDGSAYRSNIHFKDDNYEMASDILYKMGVIENRKDISGKELTGLTQDGRSSVERMGVKMFGDQMAQTFKDAILGKKRVYEIADTYSSPQSAEEE